MPAHQGMTCNHQCLQSDARWKRDSGQRQNEHSDDRNNGAIVHDDLM